MIENYVNKLIDNLPEDTKTKFQRIDLVLDGGVFNGSYLVGAVYFLKEMERRKYIKIERISGCSVGAVVGLLYYIDALDMMPELYEIINAEFKSSLTLSTIKDIKNILKNKIPDDICSKINNKFFICYNDVKNKKKIVKSNYKNIDELIDTIIKSCFVPFFIDNNLLYKNKYMDGINAHIFKKYKNKRILHMELFSIDKFMYALSVKNEKTNFHRILAGLLDVHTFYIKKSSTYMCSYVDEWSIINKCKYNAKLLAERIIVFMICLIKYLNKYIPNDIKDSLTVKIFKKISFEIMSVILETYCL